jgi:hypothetical protein
LFLNPRPIHCIPRIHHKLSYMVIPSDCQVPKALYHTPSLSMSQLQKSRLSQQSINEVHGL